MKKILSVLLAVMLMISVCSTGLFSTTASVATKYTDGYYTYTVSGGEATITCADFSISGDITIPSELGGYSVTNIGDNAFFWCRSLESVNIPDSVKSIGDNAFSCCTNLETVTIGDNVESIGDYAFISCTSIKTVTIGDSVESIGDYAFEECVSLESVNIPDSVKSIGKYAFEECISLKNVTIGDGVESIGNYAFEDCTSLTAITVNDDNSFYSSCDGVLFDKNKTKLIIYPAGKTETNYTIPDNVKSIGSYAFYNCTSLKTLIVGNNVESIGLYAFCDCKSLESITIPDGVVDISGGAFEGTAYYNNSNNWIDDVLYIDNHLIVAKYTVSDNYTVKDGTVSIAWHAFFRCENLKSITIPDSVTSIGWGAFDGCSNLNDVWYKGDEIDELNIIISEYNEKLISATWHYNATGFENYDIESIFPDTSNSGWYADAVAYVYSQGIMSGYSNGKFGTSDGIQRQDFLVMLARYDGVDLTQYGYDCTMPDVARGSYYEAAVNWGVQNGITTGYMNGKFGVGDMITREQIVTFLYRYAKYKNIDVENVTDTKAKAFPDYNKVTDFAETPIIWAIDKGVINGKSGYIAPQGNAQRCEIAQIMYNIFLKDIF